MYPGSPAFPTPILRLARIEPQRRPLLTGIPRLPGNDSSEVVEVM